MKQRDYRYVVGRLRKHDSRFEIHIQRGKGSHRMIYHPDVEGNKRHYPLPHHGPRTAIAPGMQRTWSASSNFLKTFSTEHCHE